METNDKRQNGDWGTGMKARLSAILICCVSLLPYAASAEAGDGNQGGLLIGDRWNEASAGAPSPTSPPVPLPAAAAAGHAVQLPHTMLRR